jgi:hypothetical protein
VEGLRGAWKVILGHTLRVLPRRLTRGERKKR